MQQEVAQTWEYEQNKHFDTQTLAFHISLLIMKIYLQPTLLSQACEGLTHKQQLQINFTNWLPWFHV